MLRRVYNLLGLALGAVVLPVTLFEWKLERIRPSAPDLAHGFTLFFKGSSGIIYISAADRWWLNCAPAAAAVLLPPLFVMALILDRRDRRDKADQR